MQSCEDHDDGKYPRHNKRLHKRSMPVQPNEYSLDIQVDSYRNTLVQKYIHHCAQQNQGYRYIPNSNNRLGANLVVL